RGRPGEGHADPAADRPGTAGIVSRRFGGLAAVAAGPGAWWPRSDRVHAARDVSAQRGDLRAAHAAQPPQARTGGDASGRGPSTTRGQDDDRRSTGNGDGGGLCLDRRSERPARGGTRAADRGDDGATWPGCVPDRTGADSCSAPFQARRFRVVAHYKVGGAAAARMHEASRAAAAATGREGGACGGAADAAVAVPKARTWRFHEALPPP